MINNVRVMKFRKKIVSYKRVWAWLPTKLTDGTTCWLDYHYVVMDGDKIVYKCFLLTQVTLYAMAHGLVLEFDRNEF